jgi:hypothetical protein
VTPPGAISARANDAAPPLASPRRDEDLAVSLRRLESGGNAARAIVISRFRLWLSLRV